MSATTIYRLSCDAPTCTATAVTDTLTAMPDGWRRVSSTDHLDGWKPGPRRTAAGRRYTDRRSPWDVHAGAFTLHLCPDHLGVFDNHLPRTEGHIMRARERERNVNVGCSCGVQARIAKDIRWVGADPLPNGDPERSWWRHLPKDLREYATRKAHDGP